MKSIKKYFSGKYLHVFLLIRVFFYFLISIATAQNKEKILDQIICLTSSSKSIESDFTQSDSKGNIFKGKLLINGSHKFRFNYYFPFPIVIIANKNHLIFYDYEMEQATYFRPEENVFYLLFLKDKVSFKKYFQIISFNENKEEIILTLNCLPINKKIQASFSKEGKYISALKIYEDNNIILLKFEKFRKVLYLNDNLFCFQPPEVYGALKQLSKEELEKYYTIPN